MNDLFFILGPTSSGKSSIAVALAERINGEVVSCDSMQVYKDMDILTQAPAEELTSRVPHHLTRLVPPEEEFNAARFAKLAGDAAEDIISRGKVPVFAGGTGLYVKALVDGLFSAPPGDKKLRTRLERLAAEHGNGYLHDMLTELDPEAASEIHPNNVKKVIRAIEVYETTGKTVSEKKQETKGLADRYDCRMFGLEWPREELYSRIENTVDRMFVSGLIDEVVALLSRNLSITAGKALGIKEVKAFLNGECGEQEAKEELKKNTRCYAKRQLTWFRADKRIKWINASRSAEEIVDDMVKM
jgi:tRNA dimethylallyltransferase